MCFGSEFDHGTFQSLLSQPAHRIQIWWEKIVALFISLGALHVVFCTGLLILKSSMQDDFALVSHLILGWMIILHAGIGGPLLSLLLRQTHLAVWVSMVAPLLMIVVPQLINHIAENFMGFTILGDLVRRGETLTAVLTVPWYILAYPVARNKFLNFEVAPTDRHAHASDDDDRIVGSERTAPASPSPFLKNPWVAVIGKELQVQKATLSLAFFLLVVWLVIILLALGPERPEG